MHGIAQGTISELRGGNFRSGFVGAVAGSVAGGASGRVMGSLGVASNVGSRTAVAGIFGGLAAKASGGSFEDGAVSAAFTHLFNDEEFWRILIDEGTEAHKLLQNHYKAQGYDVEKSSSGNGVIKGGRFDIADPRTDELWEIKRNSPNGILTGIRDLQFYTNGTGFIRGGDLPDLSVNGLFMTLTNCLACNSYTYSNLGGGLIVYDTTRPNRNGSSVLQDIAQAMVNNPPPMVLPFAGGALMPLPIP